ncbi:aldehyde dehydrogenase family protein [Arhodomonas sp. AD133]|uniref:aldehyde dehydrogenase family protein n=1 Tax=Arhodomonas sp. AD133 TaxID=3415009 RepID=UPI003EC10D8B
MTIQQFIDGRLVPSASDDTLAVHNPATETVMDQVPRGAPEDVNRAVTAAHRALASWRALTTVERGRYLLAIADELERRGEEIVRLTSRNNGKPLAEARIDLGDAVATYRYYGEHAEALLDARQNADVAVAMPGYASRLRLEPVGVAALIVPWNFPLVTTAWKLAPALLAGCTAVLKPSEVTPLPEMVMAEVAETVDLPAGVLNIVNGTGEHVGAPLTIHPDVAKVSFTGSNPVGAQVMRAAAADARNISLELGGKSPIVVFEDADPDQAVEWIMAGIFFNAGQICSATSRLLVHESVAEAVLPRLKAAAEALALGDPLDEATEMGPLTTRAQYDKALTYFRQAVSENLVCLTGGTASNRAHGYFVAPTVYTHVPTDSRLWREEIFAPVLCTRTFASEDEAVALANDCAYGLAATVVSADTERAHRVADRLEAGHVWLNGPQVILPETSWGGHKASGIGRELGPWGLHAFLEVKHVSYPR